MDTEYPNYRRLHNTISIFGGRGSGKTSFLHSLINYYTNQDDLTNEERDRNRSVCVLRIIDPTILEDKGHIFLYIISLINDLVKKTFDKNNALGFTTKKKWEHALTKLAKGIPALDSVGSDYHNNSWQDDEYIMENGLKLVSSALDFEKNFHDLVRLALNILNKKVFILAFDDVDVNLRKGWPIMECIRKYLTTPYIITILTGDLRFYSNNVRLQQWRQLSDLLSFEGKMGNNNDSLVKNKLFSQVNEIEGQYLLKLFKAENRIHLYSIKETSNRYNIEYYVDKSEDGNTFEEKYRDIINQAGVRNRSIVKIFQSYLMGLSLRTQINFLQNFLPDGDNLHNLSHIETLLVRMYASNIDVDMMINKDYLANIIILEYLLREEILHDSYLLLPTNDDENINGCVAGLTMLLLNKFHKSKYLMFDYMLRIGYLRNIQMTLGRYDNMNSLCEYASAFNDIPLKNFIGLSFGYLTSLQKSAIKGSAFLYALGRKVKQSQEAIWDRIDTVFSSTGVSVAQRAIAYIPLCGIKSTIRNDSTLMYSAYNLFAGIAQILKCDQTKIDILNELKKLQLLRYFLSPDVESLPNDEQIDSLELSDEINGTVNDDSLEKFIDLILNWVKFSIDVLPPYALGRIMTRFYSGSSNISADNLGDLMHRYIIVFLNASIIEEVYEHCDEFDLLSGINFSNPTAKDKVFDDNLDAIEKWSNSHQEKDMIPVTKWMMSCPLIKAFMDITSNCYNKSPIIKMNETTVDSEYFSKYISINALLKNVKIKEI